MARRRNTRAVDVFNDLEAYSEFCRDYGYKINPTDLYNMKSYPYQQYNKYIQGKNFKDQWRVDASRFGRVIQKPEYDRPRRSR
jgi:hypothetical protein